MYYDCLDVHVPALPPIPTRAILKHRFNILDQPDQHVFHSTAYCCSKEVTQLPTFLAAPPNKNVGLVMRMTPIRLQTENQFNLYVGSG